MASKATSAEYRAKAMAAEEKSDWKGAAEAWDESLAALSGMQGSVIRTMQMEIEARARAARSRMDSGPEVIVDKEDE